LAQLIRLEKGKKKGKREGPPRFLSSKKKKKGRKKEIASYREKKEKVHPLPPDQKREEREKREGKKEKRESTQAGGGKRKPRGKKRKPQLICWAHSVGKKKREEGRGLVCRAAASPGKRRGKEDVGRKGRGFFYIIRKEKKGRGVSVSQPGKKREERNERGKKRKKKRDWRKGGRKGGKKKLLLPNEYREKEGRTEGGGGG